MAIFDEKIEIRERCKGVHCVDLGESFQTHIYLQRSASIQPRTSPSKFYPTLFNIIHSCPECRPAPLLAHVYRDDRRDRAERVRDRRDVRDPPVTATLIERFDILPHSDFSAKGYRQFDETFDEAFDEAFDETLAT